MSSNNLMHGPKKVLQISKHHLSFL